MGDAETNEGQVRAAEKSSSWRPLVAIVVAGVMAVAVQMRFPYLNGPWYYTWIWQRMEPGVYWPLLGAAAVPVFLGVWVFERWVRRDWGVFWICMGLVGMTLVTSYLQPRMPGWERTIRIVRSPGATSYFTAANEYFAKRGMGVGEFMGRYTELQPKLFLHAQTKPAGPILYYAAWVKAFGGGMGTALAAGLSLLALTCASVAGVSWVVRVVTEEARAGVYAAAAYVLCPATIVFYPGFDSVYPAIACAMVGTWVMAVRTGSAKWAVGFGVALAGAMFATYVLLLLGAFLGVYSVVALWVVPGWTIGKLVRQGAIAVGMVIVVYGVLWLGTGYSAWGAYWESKRLLEEALKWVRRPYPATIKWDLYDYSLGLGWVPVVMVGMYLARRKMVGSAHPTEAPSGEMRWVAILALVQPVVVAVSFLVPGETSRCWQVLIPLVMIPVGAELARWDRGGRAAYYVGALAVLAAVAGRMSFINTEPIDKLIEMGLL